MSVVRCLVDRSVSWSISWSVPLVSYIWQISAPSHPLSLSVHHLQSTYPSRAGHIADLDESLCKLAKILELLFVKDWDLARPSTPCIFIVHKMKKKSRISFPFPAMLFKSFSPWSSPRHFSNQTFVMQDLGKHLLRRLRMVLHGGCVRFKVKRNQC